MMSDLRATSFPLPVVRISADEESVGTRACRWRRSTSGCRGEQLESKLGGRCCPHFFLLAVLLTPAIDPYPTFVALDSPPQSCRSLRRLQDFSATATARWNDGLAGVIASQAATRSNFVLLVHMTYQLQGFFACLWAAMDL